MLQPLAVTNEGKYFFFTGHYRNLFRLDYTNNDHNTNPGYFEYLDFGRKQKSVFTRVKCHYSEITIYMLFGQKLDLSPAHSK